MNHDHNANTGQASDFDGMLSGALIQRAALTYAAAPDLATVTRRHHRRTRVRYAAGVGTATLLVGGLFAISGVRSRQGEATASAGDPAVVSSVDAAVVVTPPTSCQLVSADSDVLLRHRAGDAVEAGQCIAVVESDVSASSVVVNAVVADPRTEQGTALTYCIVDLSPAPDPLTPSVSRWVATFNVASGDACQGMPACPSEATSSPDNDARQNVRVEFIPPPDMELAENMKVSITINDDCSVFIVDAPVATPAAADPVIAPTDAPVATALATETAPTTNPA